MNLAEQFKQHVVRQNLLPETMPSLLAVSGGIDSMVMLHLFRAARFTFGIAHCNFQLRGEESELDAEFVRKTAEEFGVPCYVRCFDTDDYARENGISTQMAARELRYSWFKELIHEYEYGILATAHNLNDSVETALLNFTRGTGLAGLGGIKNHPDDKIIRPMLFATREEILEYAKAESIAWREDSSNEKDVYDRNYLRHHILPELQKLNPDFLHTAARNVARLQETSENFDFLLDRYVGTASQLIRGAEASVSIEKQKIAELPDPSQVLHELLKNRGFTTDQCRQLSEKLQQTGFQISSESGWQVLIDRTELLIRASSAIDTQALNIHSDDLMCRLSDGTALFLFRKEIELPLPDGKESVMLDPQKIRFPLSVRKWVDGDAFQPFGMGGKSQKLQDFFTNQKLSRFEKEKVWLLVNGDGTIIWVMGYRLDERFRVPDGLSEGLMISWK
ncbi:MAG: tRNA lysidine(34) synthetase TilS [Lewinellaceae bacterium]|nr:tRNA lysidine(34) synthetase TilS [Lewinellaceae bacterium]